MKDEKIPKVLRDMMQNMTPLQRFLFWDMWKIAPYILGVTFAFIVVAGVIELVRYLLGS